MPKARKRKIAVGVVIFLLAALVSGVALSLNNLSSSLPSLNLVGAQTVALFDSDFNVRRVATLCPPFTNPFDTISGLWCSGENTDKYYQSFLDPSPVPSDNGLERGFYSLTVAGGTHGGTLGNDQTCMVNAPGCAFTFRWDSAAPYASGNVADMYFDARRATNTNGCPNGCGYMSFGSRQISEGNKKNYYAGSTNHPILAYAKLDIQIWGQLIATDGNAQDAVRYLMIMYFGTLANSYEVDVNIGHAGAAVSSGSCWAGSWNGHHCAWDDAWSTTEKYAYIRDDPNPSGGPGYYRQIYIGAQAWGLPALDLSGSGSWATYDIDFGPILSQMVADGVVASSDVPGTGRGEFGFSIEDQGGMYSRMELRAYTLYDTSVSAVIPTTTASSSIAVATTSGVTTISSASSFVTSTGLLTIFSASTWTVTGTVSSTPSAVGLSEALLAAVSGVVSRGGGIPLILLIIAVIIVMSALLALYRLLGRKKHRRRKH